MYICNKKKQIRVEVYVCEYKKDQQLFIKDLSEYWQK